LAAFPKEQVLSPPTLTMTETFECWTAAGSDGAHKELGHLLVAYRIDRADLYNLYRFDFDARQYSLLVSAIQRYNNIKSPVSPDGQHFWYSLYKASPGDVVFVYDLTDGTARQVPFPVPIDASATVVWSPNSQCLMAWNRNMAFVYRLSDGALQAESFAGMDFGLDSTVVTRSLDGRWWAWGCAKRICIINPSNGHQLAHEGLGLPIRSDPRSDYYNPSASWWSPDSHILAIAYPGYDWQFWDAVRLVYIDEGGVSSFQNIEFKEPTRIFDLEWSPDSSQLLMHTFHHHEDSLDVYDLATKKITTLPNPDGNALTDVAVWSSPAWSPDGKQIATVAHDNRSLYVMNADGTSASPIPSLPRDAEGADKLTPDRLIYHIFWIP
jgi:Tol biopolymer transport system component